jgi:hypothetical protein
MICPVGIAHILAAGWAREPQHPAIMLTKPLVLALIAACGIHSSAPTEQPLKPPEIEEGGEDQHFCCSSVDFDTASGDGCVAIAKESINLCNDVLYCDGKWGKKGDTVKCL